MRKQGWRRFYLGLILVIALLPACGNKTGSGSGGVEGVASFTFTVSLGRVVFSVIFDKLKLDAGAMIPLARPHGAFVQLTPDFNSGGTLFAISSPLSSLVMGNEDLMEVGLPDGRPIPFVSAGVLGAVAVNLPVIGITYLYLGSDVLGIFFPLNLTGLPAIVRSNIRDDKGNLMGILAGIPKKGTGTVSGALFLFPLDGGV